MNYMSINVPNSALTSATQRANSNYIENHLSELALCTSHHLRHHNHLYCPGVVDARVFGVDSTRLIFALQPKITNE